MMWIFYCDQWGNTFFWIKMTNGFSSKSKFNKFLLLILLVFLSNRFKLKGEINKNLINRNINLWIKKQLNFESEYKGHKSGENPNFALEFMKLSGISGSSKNFLCVFGFADLDICWSRLTGIHTFLLHSSNYFSDKKQQQI